MREYVGPAVVALLCILALGLAAATLTSPEDATGDAAGDRGTIEQDELKNDTAGNSSGSNEPPDWMLTDNPEDDEGFCVSPLAELPTLPLLLGVSLLLSGAVLVAVGRLAGLVTFSLSFSLLFFVLLILVSGCGDPSATVQDPPSADMEVVNETTGAYSGEANASEEGNEGTAVSLPSLVVVPVVFLVLLGVVYVLVRKPDEDAVGSEEKAFVDDPEEATMTVGEVAGQAADRLAGDAELENEVYRAWAGMATALDVDDPNRSSPAEVAEAARQAGVDPDDVRELTGLFEEVRYGSADPTAGREQRAIDALRRIERTDAGMSDGTLEDSIGDDGRAEKTENDHDDRRGDR